MSARRLILTVSVFAGIVLVFLSYVALNYAPPPERWAAVYAWDPSTGGLLFPTSGAGATQPFVLRSAVDAITPFVPPLAVPYLSYLLIVPFVVPLLNLAAPSYRRFLTVGVALIVSQLLLNVSYWFFQSTVPRTATLPEGVFGWLVGLVWGHDQPFNAYPSAHCTWTTIAIVSLWRLRHRFPKTSWILMPWLLLVYPATVMLQQHYWMDVYAGIFVGFATYWAVMFAIERPALVPTGELPLTAARMRTTQEPDRSLQGAGQM